VERVFSYQLYDDNPTSTIKFGSMGLINSDKTPRPAAQFLSQANQLIGEYSYKQTLNSDPVVDRYELNGKLAYVLVVPDERGRTAAYTLNLGSAAYADVYRPTVGSTSMAVQRVALQGGQLSIQVTETPVFVLPGTFSAPQASTSTCSATGTILREEWANVGGDFVVNIPLQTTPSSTSQLTQMATNIASSNNYGARIRGYVCPPQSGAYTFFVVGDDQAELWLSSDDNPANKTRVASCSVWTPSPFAWTQSAAQQSAPVQLVAGRRYYLEALHKQGWGNGYVSVAWQLPSGTLEGPIPSSRLSPFVPTANRGTGSTTKADTTQTTAAKAGFEKATLSAAPNPFANESTVRFRVVAPGPTSLMLYDLRGQLVRQLFAGTLEAGVEKEVSVRADGLATGIYDIRLVTNASVLHHRVVVAR
jgi:endoglucanase